RFPCSSRRSVGNIRHIESLTNPLFIPIGPTPCAGRAPNGVQHRPPPSKGKSSEICSWGGYFLKMSESGQSTLGAWLKPPLLHLWGKLQKEDRVVLVLALVIGALTGLAVVTFIL